MVDYKTIEKTLFIKAYGYFAINVTIISSPLPLLIWV